MPRLLWRKLQVLRAPGRLELRNVAVLWCGSLLVVDNKNRPSAESVARQPMPTCRIDERGSFCWLTTFVPTIRDLVRSMIAAAATSRRSSNAKPCKIGCTHVCTACGLTVLRVCEIECSCSYWPVETLEHPVERIRYKARTRRLQRLCYLQNSRPSDPNQNNRTALVGFR